MRDVIRRDRFARSWAGCAVAGLLALTSCGPPEEPRTRTERGALGEAMSELDRESAAVPRPSATRPLPYIVIRFDRPGIAFEDTLYSAMSRALDRHPAAQFDVILAMPPLTPKANPEEALRRGEQHIEDVVLAMTDMGLPAARLRIAASTDVTASVDEIRIFVR